ncbi:nucleotidyltransferase family protein [Magnetococcales bacterium HHB-1]
MIDLAPQYLKTVKQILAKHVPDCEVRAFGSRVQGTARNYSDLDLAVVGKGKIERRRLNRLVEAFEESDLPIRVDTLDWWAVPETFRGVIEKKYEVIRKTEFTEHQNS